MGPLILVTGLPRSGTSLVAGVIRACGAWTGLTTGPSEWNRKGNVENEAIREQLVKPYLARIPACPLGLRSLPVVGLPPQYSAGQWRARVGVFLRRQGYPGGPLVYKDAKLALMWRQWALAYPDARWVIVCRHMSAIVDSVMRAEPMRRQFDGDEQAVWNWAQVYEAHVTSIAAARRTMWPGDDSRPLIDWLGLDWNQGAVDEWIDWDMYHGDR
jgi:hypothetical protein